MKKADMLCTGFELQEMKDGRPRQIHWAMCVIFFYFKSIIKKMKNDRRGEMERPGFEPLISGVRSNNLSSETLTKDLWFLRLEIEWQLRDNKTQILRFNSKQSACSAPLKVFLYSKFVPYMSLCWEKDKNKHKEAGFGPSKNPYQDSGCGLVG